MLLEPMMAVEVETPEDFMGNVVGDLVAARDDQDGRPADRQGDQGRIAARRDVRLFDDAALALRGRATYDGIPKHYAEARRRRRAVIKKT